MHFSLIKNLEKVWGTPPNRWKKLRRFKRNNYFPKIISMSGFKLPPYNRLMPYFAEYYRTQLKCKEGVSKVG